jgi:hypothetical protein
MAKQGNDECENDDACFPCKQGEFEGDRYSVSLADGATEGSFSRQWAQYLAENLLTQAGHELGDSLSKKAEEWQHQRDIYIGLRCLFGQPLQWWEEQTLLLPSFSTILSFVIEETGNGYGEWSAFAVGDTCLFQVHEDKFQRLNEPLIVKFPISRSDGFDNRPFLLSSDNSANRDISKYYSERRGNWQPNDQFYLMTDALACWFLQIHESGRKPWRILRDLLNEEPGDTFPDFVENLRKQRDIRNDDTTLICVDLG